MNDEINKIISQHKQGLYHEALGNIKILLFEQNNNPILYNLSGIVYLSLKDYEKFGFVVHAKEQSILLLKKYWKIPSKQIKNSVVLERF